ncbi:hypothetical protein HACA111877_08480 [Halomonas casei]
MIGTREWAWSVRRWTISVAADGYCLALESATSNK